MSQAWVASLLEPGEVEGVGEEEGCTGREIELEHSVEELSYTVARLREERSKVQGQLAALEEQVLTLLQEVKEQEQGMRELKEEVRREQESKEGKLELEEKISKLEIEGRRREGMVEELGSKVIVAEQELEDVTGREREAREGLAEKEQECQGLRMELREAKEEAEVERKVRDEAEEQLDEARLQVRLLTLPLEEGGQEVESRIGVERFPGQELSQYMVHDTSVDDRLLSTCDSAVPHLLLHSPTPCNRRVSLIEELQEVTERERSRLPCIAGPNVEPQTRFARRLVELGGDLVVGGPEMVQAVQRAVEAYLQEQEEEVFEEDGASLAAWHLDLDGMQLETRSRNQEPGQEPQLSLSYQQEFQASRSGWCRGWRSLLPLLVGLLVFTFCGVQIDTSHYYPATWHALR